MPWVAVSKRGRRAGALARWRAVHREALFGWAAAAVAIVLLLGFWFVLAHKLAGGRVERIERRWIRFRARNALQFFESQARFNGRAVPHDPVVL